MERDDLKVEHEKGVQRVKLNAEKWGYRQGSSYAYKQVRNKLKAITEANKPLVPESTIENAPISLNTTKFIQLCKDLDELKDELNKEGGR